MIISCSGASHSAKSTFAESLKRLYPEVIRQDEIKLDKVYEDDEIRTERGLSIDQIRQDPYLYFRWEKAIINKKIDQERTAALKYPRDSIIIFERSLADSFYYLTRFVDISNFTSEQMFEYNSFVSRLLDVANIHYATIYDYVLIFTPVKFEILEDERRAKNLKNDHFREFHTIRLLNKAFIMPHQDYKLQNVSMSSVPLDTIDEYSRIIFNSIEDIHKNLQKR